MKLEEKLQNVATPSYVMDEKKLRENLEVLKMVQDRTGCHILLAQKLFHVLFLSYDWQISKRCYSKWYF